MAESVGQREERYRVDNIYWGPRYEAANQQMTIRIAARENILIGYIAAAATLIAVAFGSQEFRQLALVIPYMAAAVAMILLNHENVIRQLEAYLADITKHMPNDWSGREAISRERIMGLGYRTAALFLIIGVSSSAAILVGRDVTRDSIVVWWGGILFTVVATILIVWPRIRRMRQYLGWFQTESP